jgi:hypothetical protein
VCLNRESHRKTTSPSIGIEPAESLLENGRLIGCLHTSENLESLSLLVFRSRYEPNRRTVGQRTHMPYSRSDQPPLKLRVNWFKFNDIGCGKLWGRLAQSLIDKVALEAYESFSRLER